MDLLFKRYASPFSFIDGMMQSGRFDEFVVEFINTVIEEKDEATKWDFYLHKVRPDMSYPEFIETLENDKQIQNMTEEQKASTVNEAMEILNNFNPERGE